MAETHRPKLNSWGEIAKYLGWDARTIRRWEKDKALPIHRVPGGKRQAVYAYPDELDAWLNRTAPDVQTSNPDSSLAPPRKGWSRYWVGLALAAGIVSVVLGVLLLSSLRHADAPNRVTFAGTRILAWDGSDRLAWSYDFRRVVDTHTTGFQEPRIVDLDGDREAEVVAAVTFIPDESASTQESELYCFSSGGRLRWRYQPDITVRSTREEFRGPWHVSALVISPEKGAKNIWMALAHHTSWPSLLTKIDPAGKASIQFFNAGVIYSLAYTKNASGAWILAGGRNTEYDAGAVAVIGADQPPAVAPQSAGSTYECVSCTRGMPLRYFVFPRSDVNRAMNGNGNSVRSMRVQERGVQVLTSEVQTRDQTSEAYYELSPEFELQSTYWGSGVPWMHQELEQRGRIKHRVQDCPEWRTSKLVRLWTPQDGWRDVAVPWAE